MAPEQFGGAGSGPPADLFAWAATVVCAATGKPPFGSGDLPSVLNRILTAEADLGDLRGDLRDLVARCLAKDPAARPTAARALLTLLGHPVPPQGLLTEGTRSAAPPSVASPSGGARASAPVGSAGSPSAHPPSTLSSGPSSSSTPVPVRRLGRRLARAGAGAAAVLVAAVAVTVTIKLTRTTTVTGTAGTGTTATTGQSGAPSAEPPGAATAAEVMPTTATTTTKIPGTKITLHENPADPIWASSAYGFLPASDGSPAYVRDAKTGEFQYFGNFQRPTVSPHGTYVAALSLTTLNRTDYNTIRLVTTATGEDVELRTTDKPGDTTGAMWHDSGRYLLMTLYTGSGVSQTTAGFVIVDAATKTVRSRLTAGGGKAGYFWGPDASTLMRQDRDGAISFVGLDGTEVRSFPGKGVLIRTSAATLRIGTGTATVFSTTCPGTPRDVCLWDAVTGTRKAVVPIGENTTFSGWLGRDQFLAMVTKGGTSRVVLAGLDGKTKRVLAEGPAKQLKAITVWYSTK
ncbi:MAG TPA: hypothetical protein VM347_14710, partial [Nonomuraea sp.]|nr:hypothetical protein [Nonomuraea sp.]